MSLSEARDLTLSPSGSPKPGIQAAESLGPPRGPLQVPVPEVSCPLVDGTPSWVPAVLPMELQVSFNNMIHLLY